MPGFFRQDYRIFRIAVFSFHSPLLFWFSLLVQYTTDLVIVKYFPDFLQAIAAQKFKA